MYVYIWYFGPSGDFELHPQECRASVLQKKGSRFGLGAWVDAVFADQPQLQQMYSKKQEAAQATPRV